MEYLKICPICGSKFKTNNDQTIYCSHTCKRSVKRKRDREYIKAKREGQAAERKKAREEYERARQAEAEKRHLKSKADFEQRCKEGDLHALLLREKATNGTLSRKYWELYAKAAIDDAEKAGTTARILVNNHSVYEDGFADSVLESIRECNQIIITTPWK